MLPLVVALSFFSCEAAKTASTRATKSKPAKPKSLNRSLEEEAAEALGVDKSKIEVELRNSSPWAIAKHGDEEYAFHKTSLFEDEESRVKGVRHIRLLSDLGIGPKFVGTSKYNKYCVCKCVKGKFLGGKDKLNSEELKNFAIALKKLHSAPEKSKAKPVRYDIRYKLKSIKREKIALPTGYLEKCQEIIAKMKAAKKKMAFCHGDLKPRNVIFGDDGNVYFIYKFGTGIANVYDEIANVFIYFRIDGEDQNTFLTAYFGRQPTQEEIDIIRLAQTGECILMSARLFARSEPLNAGKTKMQVRVKRLDNELKEYSKNKTDVDFSLLALDSYYKDEVRREAILWYLKAIGLSS
jgi:thiamine kinase-like enzyme